MPANTMSLVRTGCYLRISSDPRDRREGVDRQREDTSVLCEAKGWTPVECYIDNDRSASNGQARPEWDRLLSDIKAGKIDAIAAWDQDRGWRMMAELETLRKFFTSVGRRVLFATTGQGDIDLYSPTGILAVQIKTAVTEHEIAQMKVRMRRAARQKAERGKPQWRHAFGYTDNYQLNPLAAPWVEKVYAHVLAGGSISDGARMLNDGGALAERWVWPRDENGDRVDGAEMECIRTPWSPSTLSLFLRKPRNCGLRDHNDVIVTDSNGQPVKGTWPPLVEESTWYAVRDILNAAGRAPGPKSVRQHLLTGVLKCGKCGDGQLNGKWIKATKSAEGHAITYSCKVCRGCAIRASDVEPLVHHLVAERLGRKDAVDLTASKAHDSAEAAQIRQERNALLASIEKANREYDDDIIDGERLRGRLKRAQEKLDALKLREQDPRRHEILGGLPLGNPDKMQEALRALSPDRFRAVVDLLVTFVVDPVGRGAHNRKFNPERVRDEWKV